jgi:tetratricopeptide (TPR) repeat protein
VIGSAIGPYLIASELGSGGMGTVYLAEVTESTPVLDAGSRVALKVVHPHLLATPGFFKRFLQEAEVGKRIEHENVVRTFDVDATLVDDKQINYMVMEYVEGKSLRELLVELRQIPESLLREVALQTAAGLAAVHAENIVHRDLKPENVLITGDHQVQIMDLGVAKLQEASIALTKEGQFTGSLLYASPEQCEGKDVGTASDLYALGVMLYELATAKNPFRRDDAVAIIKAHISHEPQRARDLNPELSAFFSEVIATLLAKDPAQRFASAAELGEVLTQAEHSPWWAEKEKHLHTVIAELPSIQIRRETELHGREQELKSLADAWQQAKEGEGRVVYLEGEAGLGKSRLIDAFLRSLAGEDAHILYGSYPPSGGLGGLSDAMLGKFGSAGMEENLAPYMDVTPTLIPAFAALIRHENPPTGSEPLHGDALHAVVCNIMRALAAEKPTIWVIEDLQFAPVDSRNLLLSMARAAAPHRVLVIASARHLQEADLANVSRLDHFRRIQLGRLGAREVIELVRDALGSSALAEKLGGKIAYKSDGVPFFIFEMIRGLKEGRFLTQQADGTYVQTQMITDIEVPSAVRDLIEARLKDLSDDDRALLDVAAVQGYEFDAGLIAQVRELKKVQVLERLAALERRHGVIRSESGNCRFDHYQLQEILYNDLMADLRAEYHALIADAFIEREDLEPEDAEGDEAYFVARHHLRGSRPKRARPYLERAFDYLERAYQNDAAIDLAELALKRKRVLKGADRLRTMLKMAARMASLGRREDEHRVATESVELADELGEVALRVNARVALGTHLWVKGENELAVRHLRDALALAEPLDDPSLSMSVYHGLGIATSYLGDHQGAIAHFERAYELARSCGDKQRESNTQGSLGVVAWLVGRYADRKRHHEASRELGLATGSRGREAMSEHNLGNVFSDCGALEEAESHQRRALQIAREIGERRTEGLGQFGLGEAAERRGATAEAMSRFTGALDVFRGIGHGAMEVDSLIAIGRVHVAEGDSSSAQSCFAAARDMSAELALHAKRILAIAWAAVLGGAPPEQAEALLAEHEAGMPFHERMHSRFLLWKATGKRHHLDEAHRLLIELRDHAPEEYRESMIENVPLNREIMQAWEEHGG